MPADLQSCSAPPARSPRQCLTAAKMWVQAHQMVEKGNLVFEVDLPPVVQLQVRRLILDTHAT